MVKVRVPASISNLGAGFDCFGMALRLYLTVEMESIRRGLHVSVFGEGGSEIAFGEENLIFKAAQKLYQVTGIRPPGFRIRINNEIPLSKGLGSSGAATIAGLVGAAKLTQTELPEQTLLSLAHQIEGHPENASASLFGGFTINCIQNDQVICKKVTVSEDLNAVLVVPTATVSTREARKALPKNVPYEDAVFNLQCSSLFTHAFLTGNVESLREAMQDRLHQPYRKHLIPGFDEFERSGYENGALGVCVSGSGSAVLALTHPDSSERLLQKWTETAHSLKIAASVLAPGIENTGVELNMLSR